MKEILEKAIDVLSKQPPLLKLKGKIMVVGDTHGDVLISREIIKKFVKEEFDSIVFLGDYIDRAPPDVSSSVENIDYLLKAMVEYENIYLLKGNHEANYAIPCYPNEFEYEVKKCCPSLYNLYVRAFMEMPLMAIANNVYLAHGGFPLKPVNEVEKNDIYAIEEITWSDVGVSRVYRGAGFKFDGKMLGEFLARINARAFVRGHDYTLNGIIAYKKCLTIFSSRRYENEGNGGILVAEIHGNIEKIGDIKIKRWKQGRWIDYEPAFI